jgi:hypothetical protein
MTCELKANEALGKKVATRLMDIAPEIKKLQESGAKSLREIAAGLNEASSPTARGGKWSAVQISRVLGRMT